MYFHGLRLELELQLGRLALGVRIHPCVPPSRSHHGLLTNGVLVLWWALLGIHFGACCV